MSQELQTQARRGPKLKGNQKRHNYNVSLHPAIAETAKTLADSTGESFSGMIERLLKGAIKTALPQG